MQKMLVVVHCNRIELFSDEYHHMTERVMPWCGNDAASEIEAEGILEGSMPFASRELYRRDYLRGVYKPRFVTPDDLEYVKRFKQLGDIKWQKNQSQQSNIQW